LALTAFHHIIGNHHPSMLRNPTAPYSVHLPKDELTPKEATDKTETTFKCATSVEKY